MTVSDDTPPASHQTKIERELWAAFERLQKEIANGKRSRISFSAVAAEANCSRTLIGHDDCAYPEVRRAVAEAIRGQKGIQSTEANAVSSSQMSVAIKRAPTTHASAIALLKEEIALLTKQNRMAAIKIVTIDDENQQLREQIKTLKTKLERKQA